MRKLAFSLLAALAIASASPASANQSPTYRGLWVSTDFPSQTIAPGKSASLEIDVHNAGLPPQIVGLVIEHAPKDWKVDLLGGGNPVQSVFAGPDSKATVNLRLTPPAGVTSGSQGFILAAESSDGRFELPLKVTIGDVAPANLKLESDLPELRGSVTSKFEYKISLANNGGKDLTARLDADAPQGFQATFRERYGSQELTSIPLKAGEKRDLTLRINPPRETEAGIYKVEARATTAETAASTALVVDVTGRPELSLSGADGRLSGDAQAGTESALDLVVANNGSAPAMNIDMSSSEPSGWKIKFEPDKLAAVAPGEEQKIKVLITPSAEAIAGDYQVSLRATGGEGSTSTNFRITVRTSTMWGIAGVLTIAASLGVLGMSVVRYGRR